MKKWLACLLLACCLITATANADVIYFRTRENMEATSGMDEYVRWNRYWDLSAKAPLYWGMIYCVPNGYSSLKYLIYVDESAPILRHNIYYNEEFEVAKANGELVPDPDEPGIWRAPDWPDLDLEAAYRSAWGPMTVEDLSRDSETKQLYREWIAGMTEEEFAEAFPLDKPYGHFWQDWLNAVYTD